jgi:mono/diheme cytochrome c family protein
MKLLLFIALLQAQNATPRPGFRAGPPLYQQNCGSCHDGQKAPSITDLQQYSPEHIYEVLTTGKMKDQAAQIPDVQKQQIAEFLAARPMGSDEAGDIKKMTNACRANPPLADPAEGPS